MARAGSPARWDFPGGWRIGYPGWTLCTTGDPEVRWRGRAAAAEVVIGDAEPTTASAHWDGDHLVLTHDGTTRAYACARERNVLWLGVEGHAWPLAETERLATGRADPAVAGGPLTSPMPGTVLTVRVARGDHVTAGTPLLVVEAMKMEHAITARVDGVVSDLYVRPGQQVALDEPLAVVTPLEQT